MMTTYPDQEPSRATVDAIRGTVVLEFGSATCGWCRAAQPLIEQALREAGAVEHIKVADARGKRLGRSFGVKLWPTLVVLRDGQEVARVIRPESAEPLASALTPLP